MFHPAIRIEAGHPSPFKNFVISKKKKNGEEAKQRFLPEPSCGNGDYSSFSPSIASALKISPTLTMSSPGFSAAEYSS